MTPALRGVVGRAQNPKTCPQPQAHNPRNVSHDEGNLQTKSRSRDWEMMVGNVRAECNTFTIFLINERGRQERQSQRRWGDGRRAWGALRCSTAGFEDGGKGHKPRKAGSLTQLGKAKK